MANLTPKYVQRPARLPTQPAQPATIVTHPAPPAARARFERLTAGHRREYTEWIIGAKRPDTRFRRLADTIERLTSEPIDAPSRSPR